MINIFGESYAPGDIYDDAQVVSGFIRGNANSKVFGYLIDGLVQRLLIDEHDFRD